MTQDGRADGRGAVRKRPRSAAPRGSAGTVRVRRLGEEERYKPGGRRTTAEPLAASWNPKPPKGRRRKQKRQGVSGLIGTYGWRVYALPILLVLTALVAVDIAGDDSPDARAANAPGSTAPGAPGDGTAPSSTQLSEKPPPPLDVNIPTADLPPGGDFTQVGANTWRVVPGTGPRIGNAGKLYKYAIEIEDGIDVATLGGDDGFAKLVDSTLAEPRGWARSGQVSVQRVDGNTKPDFRISLTTPGTAHRDNLCGHRIQYESSCYNRVDDRVVINLARWVRGALAFSGDQLGYKQYAINHEVGHAFGQGHLGCGNNGALAPVMMQQTFGVANNYVALLNQVEPSNKDKVKADGKVCKPNAWPNPTGS
ncbi:uncharacterized protein DUF3152 [Herbihabitans rhizosphaerae]|uniref:Uncharacterized protein DUF3152 n=1 Tax=Herbihabitans rhizosphaerae TaxID=1872711 RepID=A0A4Q7L4R5_9PSEU|nr:DUF3152 domain-containing protein [Herbihabitans rhizosphaerae]RZS44224.1 uncharacterized protein DUF3152 [Herbihabitans rhizosphaerae]